MTLWVDDYEPPEIIPLFKQSLEAIHAPLNHQGYADYMWIDRLSHRRQWERKQLIEYVGDMDGVEEQLNEEMRTCDELVLVVEGVGQPTHQGIQAFNSHLHRFIPSFHYPPQKLLDTGKARPRPGLWTEYEGRKWGLRAQGVQVIETTGLVGTAMAIMGAYTSSMKEEHTTFNRYLIPHVAPFDPDPHVDNLARLAKTGVGVERAKKAIREFGSFYEVVIAHESKLAKLWGPAIAKRFLSVIGR